MFLCHSSGDKPTIRDLYVRLRNDGFEPWFDEESLRPGQDWDYEIRKAVCASDIVIVCLSRSSITKAGYIQKELGFALDIAHQQPEGNIFVIPVKLEECDVPERLKKWHWVNLLKQDGYSQLIESLNLCASQKDCKITAANQGISPKKAIIATSANSPHINQAARTKSQGDEYGNGVIRLKTDAGILEASNSRRKEIVGAVAFGIAFIIVTLLIAIKFPHPSSLQFTVFRTVLALASSGIAVMIPELIHVKANTAIRTGGAIAVFVVAYLFSPAKLIVDRQAITAIGPLADGSLSVNFSNGVEIKLVPIPPGSFEMGSTEDEVRNALRSIDSRVSEEVNAIRQEIPKHHVNIKNSFWMGKFEVTQAQWRTVMGDDPSFYKHCEECPVEQVSWNDVQEFIKRLNGKQNKYIFRLPTEAEWEYAARAETKTEFAFGSTLSSEQANFNGNYPYAAARRGPNVNHPKPVGSYMLTNKFGLYDMHGNIWEWVNDLYEQDYYKHSPVDDPTGPTSGRSHVLRGGSFDNNGVGCRSAQRATDWPPGRSTPAWGFRLVCVLRH
jgi:formylglycine-generating enzyme required for sulfatase activity